jgi:glutathione S-transferase
MYKLYGAKQAGSQVVQAVLEAAGADYKMIWLDLSKDESRTDEYLQINPAGVVPTLVLPDGQAMMESAAI